MYRFASGFGGGFGIGVGLDEGASVMNKIPEGVWVRSTEDDSAPLETHKAIVPFKSRKEKEEQEGDEKKGKSNNDSSSTSSTARATPSSSSANFASSALFGDLGSFSPHLPTRLPSIPNSSASGSASFDGSKSFSRYQETSATLAVASSSTSAGSGRENNNNNNNKKSSSSSSSSSTSSSSSSSSSGLIPPAEVTNENNRRLRQALQQKMEERDTFCMKEGDETTLYEAAEIRMRQEIADRRPGLLNYEDRDEAVRQRFKVHVVGGQPRSATPLGIIMERVTKQKVSSLAAAVYAILFIVRARRPLLTSRVQERVMGRRREEEVANSARQAKERVLSKKFYGASSRSMSLHLKKQRDTMKHMLVDSIEQSKQRLNVTKYDRRSKCAHVVEGNQAEVEAEMRREEAEEEEATGKKGFLSSSSSSASARRPHHYLHSCGHHYRHHDKTQPVLSPAMFHPRFIPQEDSLFDRSRYRDSVGEAESYLENLPLYLRKTSFVQVVNPFRRKSSLTGSEKNPFLERSNNTSSNNNNNNNNNDLANVVNVSSSTFLPPVNNNGERQQKQQQQNERKQEGGGLQRESSTAYLEKTDSLAFREFGEYLFDSHANVLSKFGGENNKDGGGGRKNSNDVAAGSSRVGRPRRSVAILEEEELPQKEKKDDDDAESGEQQQQQQEDHGFNNFNVASSRRKSVTWQGDHVVVEDDEEEQKKKRKKKKKKKKKKTEEQQEGEVVSGDLNVTKFDSLVGTLVEISPEQEDQILSSSDDEDDGDSSGDDDEEMQLSKSVNAFLIRQDLENASGASGLSSNSPLVRTKSSLVSKAAAGKLPATKNIFLWHFCWKDEPFVPPHPNLPALSITATSHHGSNNTSPSSSSSSPFSLKERDATKYVTQVRDSELSVFTSAQEAPDLVNDLVTLRNCFASVENRNAISDSAGIDPLLLQRQQEQQQNEESEFDKKRSEIRRRSSVTMKQQQDNKKRHGSSSANNNNNNNNKNGGDDSEQEEENQKKNNNHSNNNNASGGRSPSRFGDRKSEKLRREALVASKTSATFEPFALHFGMEHSQFVRRSIKELTRQIESQKDIYDKKRELLLLEKEEGGFARRYVQHIQAVDNAVRRNLTEQCDLDIRQYSIDWFNRLKDKVASTMSGGLTENIKVVFDAFEPIFEKAIFNSELFEKTTVMKLFGRHLLAETVNGLSDRGNKKKKSSYFSVAGSSSASSCSGGGSGGGNNNNNRLSPKHSSVVIVSEESAGSNSSSLNNNNNNAKKKHQRVSPIQSFSTASSASSKKKDEQQDQEDNNEEEEEEEEDRTSTSAASGILGAGRAVSEGGFVAEEEASSSSRVPVFNALIDAPTDRECALVDLGAQFALMRLRIPFDVSHATVKDLITRSGAHFALMDADDVDTIFRHAERAKAGIRGKARRLGKLEDIMERNKQIEHMIEDGRLFAEKRIRERQMLARIVKHSSSPSQHPSSSQQQQQQQQQQQSRHGSSIYEASTVSGKSSRPRISPSSRSISLTNSPASAATSTPTTTKLPVIPHALVPKAPKTSRVSLVATKPLSSSPSSTFSRSQQQHQVTPPPALALQKSASGFTPDARSARSKLPNQVLIARGTIDRKNCQPRQQLLEGKVGGSNK